MIHYLKGKVVSRKDDFLVVDVGGVGYKVFISREVDGAPREEITLYCYMQRTEKEDRLYGFPTEDNLEFFEELMNISGIGPKTALRIASSLSLEEAKKGIEEENKEVMEKIFSIGKKKGEQVIFGLSRKLIKGPKKDEVFEALRELGFSNADIKDALGRIPDGGDKEEKIKEALKLLGNG